MTLKQTAKISRVIAMTAMLAMACVGAIGLTAVISSHDAMAAAKTYKSKGSLENTRHVLEKCRLKAVEVVDGVTMCVYRSQTGRRVTLTNDDPSAGCQKQFQCKR
ncbi:MAG: hypothetical protein CBC12_11265 [Candidatus Puniceispirillum sp. TMED52]|mgnify:FL=1|nr:hypothetical protein [SAR116 cluster bacterium]OUU46662.1 MAG: hypothetical protein CBC12_11265 [Candidatus Puniceispirillum sp. TMED52]|tara:strand:+ start:601 stop:915 length:315 start_codon:yes stop_codon:yes gene_type:complete